MDNTARKPSRWLSFVTRWLDGGIATIATRLELLAVEVQEEKLRIATFLFQVVVAAILFGAMLVFAVTWLTVLFWESHRLWALGLGFLFLGLTGLWMARQAARTFSRGTRLFVDSLAELRRDRESLQQERS